MFFYINSEKVNGINEYNHIHYIKPSTMAFLKHIDGSIRQCRCEEVVGFCNRRGYFEKHTYWKVAGIKGVFRHDELKNIGSLRATLEECKTCSPSSDCRFPLPNGKWYFNDDFKKLGFVSGESFYVRGYNGGYLQMFKLNENGTIVDFEYFYDTTKQTENNPLDSYFHFKITEDGIKCWIDDRLSNRIGKDLFFTEEEAKSHYNPKYITFDDEVEKDETEVKATISNETRIDTQYGLAVLVKRYNTKTDSTFYDVYNENYEYMGEVCDLPLSDLICSVEFLFAI